MEPKQNAHHSSHSENQPSESSLAHSSVPPTATPKNSPTLDSLSRHSFIKNSNQSDERPPKYFIVNPYNSSVGNPPTPENSYGVNPLNPSANLPLIANSPVGHSSILESLPQDNSSSERNHPDTLKAANISSQGHLTPENTANPPNPSVGNLIFAKSPMESSSMTHNPGAYPAGANPNDGNSPANNPANPTPPNYPPLIAYSPNTPMRGSPQRDGNAPSQDPGDAPFPNTISQLSLAYTPVSYRSSVFSLAISKFAFAPFIICLVFIVHKYSKKPLSLHLTWMLGVMLFLELLHGSLLIYGVLQKKLVVIKFCIWYTLCMGSYTSSVGIVGVMVFMSLAHYTLQFFMIFVFILLTCNIFTVLCCDLPLLVCYKQELLGHGPESRYPGTLVNIIFGRI